MIPWLEDPVVEIGSHHLGGARLLQDGSSLVGLAVVVALVWYGLRRGGEKPVPARPLQPAERRVWVSIYILATVVLSVAWLLWARAAESAWRFRVFIANDIAVAWLRGLAMALLCTSAALSWRLRALRSSSARRSP
jgi:hypothetical protein